ncbi:MAG: trigger factor [Coriobacteriales bacterium]
MKIKEKKLPEGRMQLEVRATAKEVEDAFANAYLQFVNGAGLRPEKGKTVNQIVEEKLGIKDLDAVVRDAALECLIPYTIDRSGLMPAFPPEVKSASPLRRGAEATFTLELLPKPNYVLSSYEPVHITVPPFKVDESLVDRQLEELAKRSTSYSRAAQQHEVRSGDAVLLEMESFENGKRNTGLSSAARTYVTGQGFMPQGFDEQIIGMMPGETKTFSFEGPDVDMAGNETTTTVETTVTVLEIQVECIPAITNSWLAANMPVFKTVDELKADIRKSLEAQSREAYDAQCRQLCIYELEDRFEGRIPDEAYEAMRDNLMRELDQQLSKQGVSYKDYVEQNGGQQQFSVMMMVQCREQLVQGYVLDSVFTHEKLKLEDEDYLKAARELNPQGDAAQTRSQLEATGRGFVLRETAQRRKAADHVLAHAVVTVKEG